MQNTTPAKRGKTMQQRIIDINSGPKKIKELTERTGRKEKHEYITYIT